MNVAQTADQYSGDRLAQTVARYARTFSATRRHIINPDGQDKTLCGGRTSLREQYIGDNGVYRTAAPWMVYELPACARCEGSARKRGITADTRERRIEAAHAEALDMNEGRTPVYPEGTPEYAAYAQRLRVELGKWSRREGEYAVEPRADCTDEDCAQAARTPEAAPFAVHDLVVITVGIGSRGQVWQVSQVSALDKMCKVWPVDQDHPAYSRESFAGSWISWEYLAEAPEGHTPEEAERAIVTTLIVSDEVYSVREVAGMVPRTHIIRRGVRSLCGRTTGAAGYRLDLGLVDCLACLDRYTEETRPVEEAEVYHLATDPQTHIMRASSSVTLCGEPAQRREVLSGVALVDCLVCLDRHTEETRPKACATY